MENTSAHVLLHLPVELVSIVVSQWIELRDVSFLDMACCNQHARTFLLDSVFKSHCCILRHVYELRRWHLYESWIYMRGIKLKELFITETMDVQNRIHHLNTFGRYVTSIRLHEIDFRTEDTRTMLSNLQTHCPYVTSLICYQCIVNESILDFVSAFTVLEELQLTCCEDDCSPEFSPCDIKKTLPSLRNVVLDCDKDNTLVQTLQKTFLADKMLRINVCCGTEILVEHTLQLLETCGQSLRCLGFAFSSALYDYRLGQAVRLCPNILHLDLNNCEELTDDSLSELACNLTQLRSINVSECWCTNEGLFILAEHRKDTLERLFASNCYYLTGVGFNAVLQQCHRLHTIAFTIDAQVRNSLDILLLCNIRTLQIHVHGTRLDALLEPCLRLEKLYISCIESDLDVLVLPRITQAPILHSLFISIIENSGQTDPVAYSSSIERVPIPITLQGQRPDLRILFESGENWPSYVMNLPVS